MQILFAIEETGNILLQICGFLLGLMFFWILVLSGEGNVKWYCGDYIGWCVDDVYDCEQQFDKDMFDTCEVIGNVFDNPELLEVE